jgi:hypothetical protein
MRGIEKNLMRRRREHDVGISDIESDVTSLRTLRAHRLDERQGTLEGLAEEKAAPTAIEDGVGFGRGTVTSRSGRDRGLEALLAQATEAVAQSSAAA